MRYILVENTEVRFATRLCGHCAITRRRIQESDSDTGNFPPMIDVRAPQIRWKARTEAYGVSPRPGLVKVIEVFAFVVFRVIV